MTRRLGLGEELLNVAQEAEVEHLVGLVEHHHLNVGKREQALAREVEQAPGSADDDLRARLELLDLALVGLATVDRHDLDVTVDRRGFEVFGDLNAQLARRHDDKRFDARLGVQA